MATIGLNPATVVHTAVGGATQLGQIDKARRPDRHMRIPHSSQVGAAQGGEDAACVVDLGTHQDHKSPSGRGDVPHIDHLTATCKLVLTCGHGNAGGVQGGRHQSTHFDHGTVAKHNAMGIDQEHLPVGFQLPQNARRR